MWPPRLSLRELRSPARGPQRTGPHGRSLRVASCPPRGPLRLRSGKASPAAPAGLNVKHPRLATSRNGYFWKP